MIKAYLQKFLFLVVLLPTIVLANVSIWQIIPNESTITFTGTQNDAPTTGSFKKFSGDIQFDPNQLSASSVRIVIDTNSISTSYKDVADTLITSDWFNIKLFPQAIFTAKQFSKIADNKYQASGVLTIKDKTVPVMLTFTLTQSSPSKANVDGSTTLKRTAFGIGQGEWADTDTVKDDVLVNFKITAQKK